MATVLAVGLAREAAPASATAVPEKTDIMFIFDTSGSMGGVIEEAKEGIKKVMEETSASVPNVAYGVANLEDVPGDGEGGLSEEQYEKDDEKPWRLDQPVTTETSKVIAAIEALTLCSSGDGGTEGECGGDGPEAYGRAFFETDTNPQVGWRAGARHEIVLISDNVPHTANVNEGIPEQFWVENPFDTGEEAYGRVGIPDTQWVPGDTLEFHKILEMLDVDGTPLAMVDYFHTGEFEEDNYIHYWEYWAKQTGGEALEAKEGVKEEFSKELVKIIKETTGKSLPPCPTGFEPRVGEGTCVKVPPPKPPPPYSPPPAVIVPASSPPIRGKVTVLEDGEIEEEDEFPEGGEGEDSGVVDEGASLASFQGDLLGQFADQQFAVTASKKCKKGYVHKAGKCVNNKPVTYGHLHLTVTKAGRYKLRIKPSHTVLVALKKGKTLNVTVTLVFTPAGTTDHIRSVRYVTVHLKKKHKK